MEEDRFLVYFRIVPPEERNIGEVHQDTRPIMQVRYPKENANVLDFLSFVNMKMSSIVIKLFRKSIIEEDADVESFDTPFKPCEVWVSLGNDNFRGFSSIELPDAGSMNCEVYVKKQI